MNEMQTWVKDFHVKFGHPVSEKPTLPNIERFANRKGWGAIEEAVEQLHVLSSCELEFIEVTNKLVFGLDKAIQKQLNKPFITDETEKLAALADGLGDELYFLLGDCVETGINIEPVLHLIHQANLSKLFKDPGTGELYAKNDALGKIIKSPDFEPPEAKIAVEIVKQLGK